MRRVVITGVLGGIGTACADTFRDAGWSVIGLDRLDPPPAFAGEYIRCDISKSADVFAACSDVLRMGELDALVNNAAVQVNRSLRETSDEEWEQVMNTNVRGAFQCIRNLLPALERSRGAIVNVASVHAVATSANISAYATSKGALVALTRAAAVELAHHGVRCNALLPGAVDTEMLRDGFSRRPHQDGPDGNLTQLRERTPLLSIASAEEISRSVLFLADGLQSSYITGQSLIADGGATARLSTER